MKDLVQQVRIGLRSLLRTPTFTVAAVLVLGLGIGAAAAMFTVFRAVLVERLPVQDPDRVVVLSTYKDPKVEFGLQMRDLKPIAQQAQTMRSVGGYAHWGATPGLMMDGDRSVLLNRALATGNFFDVLGARPALGRLFRVEDDAPGAAPVLVLSYSAWRGTFGSDASIIGRRLLEPYTQTQYTIIGVAPPGLDFPSGAGYWIPPWQPSDDLSIIAVARLATGATPAAARNEIFAIKSRLSPELHVVGAKSTGITQAILGDVRPVLFALLGAVGLLLLIACVNVGNLLLLRATSRSRELAVRRALGATYADIIRQLLLESTLLAVAGGALGLASAVALLRILVAFAPSQLPRVDVIQVSGTPIAVAFGVTMITLLVFGVGPALVAARGNVATTLRFDSRSGGDSAMRRRLRSRSGGDSAMRRRLRYVLVASQTALALVMLSGGLLLARSLARLEGIDLGYQAEHLSFLEASWPTQKLGTGAQLYPLGERLVKQWRAIPGVISVTPIIIPPLEGPNVFLGRLDVEGQSDADRASNPFVPVEGGNEDYFKTFGIPIVRGRGFQDGDRENAQQVAVVSEAIVRRFWPNENPIGKRIHFWGGADTTTWRTIVGVTGDVHLRSMREATPAVYIAWRQADFWQNTVAIRTSGTLASVLPALRREMKTVEPQLNLWYAKSMDDLLAEPLAQPRMSALLMGAFGVAALLLAAIGLYGVMAAVVRDGTREIGIRMALGAGPERLRREVLGRALLVSGAGAIAGGAVALGTSRLLATLLFEVSPTDPVSLVGAGAALMIVVILAAYVPARRATRIDPARALRAD